MGCMSCEPRKTCMTACVCECHYCKPFHHSWAPLPTQWQCRHCGKPSPHNAKAEAPAQPADTAALRQAQDRALARELRELAAFTDMTKEAHISAITTLKYAPVTLRLCELSSRLEALAQRVGAGDG